MDDCSLPSVILKYMITLYLSQRAILCCPWTFVAFNISCSSVLSIGSLLLGIVVMPALACFRLCRLTIFTAIVWHLYQSYLCIHLYQYYVCTLTLDSITLLIIMIDLCRSPVRRSHSWCGPLCPQSFTLICILVIKGWVNLETRLSNCTFIFLSQINSDCKPE